MDKKRGNLEVSLICVLLTAVMISGCGKKCGTSTVDDADGNTYSTVLIGDQCWMKENMRTTKYPGGGDITKGPSAHEAVGWDTDQSYYSCPPNTGNDGEDCAAAETEKLGMLYQWSAAMNGSTSEGAQGICPSGWHILTHDEFTTLEREICTSGTCTTDFPFDTTTIGWRGTNEGAKLKPGGTSGFEDLLAGDRGTGGSYFSCGAVAILWSSSPDDGYVWRRRLSVPHASVYRGTSHKANGFSVRCLKD